MNSEPVEQPGRWNRWQRHIMVAALVLCVAGLLCQYCLTPRRAGSRWSVIWPPIRWGFGHYPMYAMTGSRGYVLASRAYRYGVLQKTERVCPR